MNNTYAIRILLTLALGAGGCATGDDVEASDDATAQTDAGARRDTGTHTTADAGRHDAATDSHTTVTPADSGAPPIDNDSGYVDPPAPTSTTFCAACTSDGDCGDPSARCLTNRDNGERFCGVDCTSSSCPSGGQCVTVGTGTGTIRQCVPTAGSCAGIAPMPTPTDAGTLSTDTDLQHCVDVINMYRATVGSAPLARAAELEAFAAAGAESDSMTGAPHGHFMSTSGGGIAYGENEIPGWPLSEYGSISAIIDQGSEMMWGEGPGGGHYENMKNTEYTRVGCGVFTTPDGSIWITQDYR